MGYFVTNKGQGSGSNTGRGANPQLDSAQFSFRLLLLKLLKAVVEKWYFVAIVSSNLTIPAMNKSMIRGWKALFDLLRFHILLKGVVEKKYFGRRDGWVINKCHLCPPQADVQVQVLLQAQYYFIKACMAESTFFSICYPFKLLNDAVKQCYFGWASRLVREGTGSNPVYSPKGE